MRTELRGVDEFYDSAGVQFAPLGFGLSTDWELIEKKEITASVATVELGVGTFDPTLWDEIEIVVDQLSTATDNVALNFTVSDDDGATFEAGTGYEWLWSASRADTGARIEGHAQGAALWQIYNSWGGVSTDNHLLKMYAGRLDHAGHKTMWWNLARWDGNIAVNLTGTGAFSGNTNALNAFRFAAASGNIDGGRFYLRGRRRNPTALKSQDDWVVITDEETVAAAATHDYFWPDNVYDEIEITLTGVRVGTDIQNLEARLSSDGSTFHSGATDYKTTFYNFNDSGTGGASAESSTGAAQIKLAADLGTAADEYMDGVIHLTGVSNSLRKKKGSALFHGLISDGSNQAMNTTFIDMNTNDRCQGIQLRGEGTTTVAFDRVRIRGRRLTPIGVLKQDWELIEEKIVTTTTANLDFKDLPVSEFDELELTFKDADTDTTVNNVAMRMSNDNGATFDSGTNYHYAVHNRAAEASTYAQLSSATGTLMLMTANFGSTTVRVAHGRWYISGMASGSRPNIFGQSSHMNDSGNNRNQSGGGAWVGTGSDGVVTAFRILCDNGGSFTAGTFTLRGRRRLSAS